MVYLDQIRRLLRHTINNSELDRSGIMLASTTPTLSVPYTFKHHSSKGMLYHGACNDRMGNGDET